MVVKNNIFKGGILPQSVSDIQEWVNQVVSMLANSDSFERDLQTFLYHLNDNDVLEKSMQQSILLELIINPKFVELVESHYYTVSERIECLMLELKELTRLDQSLDALALEHQIQLTASRLDGKKKNLLVMVVML